METETISSRNTVDLLLNEEFNASICGASKTPDSESIDFELDSKNDSTCTNETTATQGQDDYVYGWDCWVNCEWARNEGRKSWLEF